MPDSVRALGEVAWDVLHRLVRELLSRKSGGHLVEARLDRLEIRLPLVLRGPDADPSTFADEVVVALDRLPVVSGAVDQRLDAGVEAGDIPSSSQNSNSHTLYPSSDGFELSVTSATRPSVIPTSVSNGIGNTVQG